MKDKEYHVANFATFVSKLLLFPQKNWMNLISDRLSTASIKYLNWPSPVFGRFQNGYNEVIIEPRVVQFWSEIILVISIRTHAAHSFGFEIIRMISAQTALHSVQLPLFIGPWRKEINFSNLYLNGLAVGAGINCKLSFAVLNRFVL